MSDEWRGFMAGAFCMLIACIWVIIYRDRKNAEKDDAHDDEP